MRRIVYNGILIWSFTIIKAKDPELPMCPTNMQYFPQNLPMHCRMPVGSASHISRSPLEKPPQPIPQQIPVNGFPGAMSGAVPGVFPGTIPGGMPLPMPGGFPGIPGGIPGPAGGIPMPMPMPMLPPPGPAHKLPVIVMPFYSQDTSDKVPQAPQRPRHKKYKKSHKKKRPKQYYSDEDSTETDTSEDDNSDSSNAGWWKNSRHSRRSNHHKSNRRKNKNRELLTPVLQYVTKDGYVIYEKQISKGEAKGWLGTKNHKDNEGETAKTVRHRQEPESREPKDEVETGFLVKEEENVETTTEDKPQVIHRKKNLKRKVSKKHM